MDVELLRKGVRLYYNILKIHRKKLPKQMRIIGDLYVKQEFHQHHANPDPQYYSKFYNEWVKYYEQFSKEGLKGVSKNMDESTEKLLNSDQKEAMKYLKEEVSKLKW